MRGGVGTLDAEATDGMTLPSSDIGYDEPGPRPTGLPVWPFVLTIVVVQLVDLVLNSRVTFEPLTAERWVRTSLLWVQDTGNLLFLGAAVVLVLVLVLRSRPRWVLAVLVAYLSVATFNLVLNVFALVATAEHNEERRLTLLWDVGLVYLSTVLVFSLWYRLLDTELAGGAFEFPVDPARPDRSPGWIDYVFLSFNTNATFGPTAEVVHARTAKVVMMCQTLLSLLVLVVLVARIVGLGD